MKTLVKTNRNMYPAIPTLLNNLLHDDWLDSTSGILLPGMTTLPAANIRETAEDYRIELAAPGMRKEDFKIEVERDVLTIAAEAKADSENKQGDFTKREFSYQAFQRSFTLPENYTEYDKVSASYQDGILEIVIPKREEVKVKPARQISVS